MKNFIKSALEALTLFVGICIFTFFANLGLTRMIESNLPAQSNCECCPSASDFYIALAWFPISFLILVVIAITRSLKRKATPEKMELL